MPLRRTLLTAFLLFSVWICPPAQAYTSSDYYTAGLNFYVLKDYAKSIPFFQRAVKMDPKNWKAWQMLGFIYYLENRQTEALAAFDQSLIWNSHNPVLWNLAEPIRARLIWEAERRDIYPHVFRNYEIWAKVQTGYMMVNLGSDLAKFTSAFQSTYSSKNYSTSASVDGSGPLAGLEVGFMLDTLNAWGIVVEGASLNGFKGTAQYPSSGISEVDSLQPDFISIQAEYYHFFKLGRTRLDASLGGGLYNTLLNMNYTDAGQVYESGQMTGLGFGGFLGLGWEIALGEQYAAGLMVRGQWAATGNLQGNFTTSSGVNEGGELGSNSAGLIDVYPQGGNGYKPVNIDYTGADFSLSISYHY
jgi:tetratricopeptide (TPR) repeat protein